MGRHRWEEDLSKKIGCCGNLVRFFIILINSIFLILGLTIFIAAAVLKWGNNDFNKFADIPHVEEIIKVGSVGTIAVAVMVIGAFIIVMSIMGIIGAKFLNNFFLIIYEIIVGILFLAHGIAILVLLFGSSSLEEDYKKAINETVTSLNKGDDDKKCDFMKGLSTLFNCCGAEKGPGDFNGTAIAEKCCELKDEKLPTEGCSVKSISELEKNAENIILIPSGIILVIELFTLIMVPCIIGKERN